MKTTRFPCRAIPLAALLIASSPVLAADDLRLGTDVVPVSQSIRLDLDAGRTSYTGSILVEIKVTKAVKSFRFHAEEMDLTSIVLKGSSGSTSLAHEAGKLGLVTVTAADPIQPGDYTLEIEFANDFGTKAVGLYRVEQDGQGYAFTQFEADDGREAFPLWDEPGFKIPYQMTITVPEDHIAVTNTPAASETVVEGKRTYVFARTKPLPSYLLAIAAGPLETRPIPDLPIDGRIVTVKGRGRYTELAARMTPPLLEAMEVYFGSQYPFEKLDLIAIPDYWPGAMENPGAITFSEPILLVDAASATVAQRQTLARVMAHELAHMWFGDLVTMKWWDDLWLNESFADWMGDKITERVHPKLQVDLGEVQSIQNTMTGDARPSSQAIRRPVAAGDNMLENVGTAYNKGKAVLGMFERWIGPDDFRKGVLEYLEAHEWGSATASDLWSKLSKASDNDVSGAMTTFLEQSGLPIVRIEPAGDGRIEISQRRFLNHGVQGESRFWKIPVTLKYSDGASERTSTVLLGSASQVVTLPAGTTIDWVMPDAGAQGYYRWIVPPKMLMSLAEESSERLTPRERIGYLGNLSALLAAGLIRGDEYLTALGHFAGDEEPLVVSSLLDGLEGVKMAFVPGDLEDAFALYVRRMLAPAVERYGMKARPGEDEAVSLLRPELMSWMGDEGRDAATLEHAESLARTYMKDPSSVDPALAAVVLKLAAIRGDRQLFEEYRKRFETTDSPADRQRYLNACGYFRDPALVEEALRYSLEGPLRQQEIFTISSGLQETAAGRQRRFKYVTDNYGAIKSRVPEMMLGFMPWFAAGCEAERLDPARAFFSRPGHDAPGTSTTMAKVTDQVTDCAALRRREGETVRAYLSKLTLAGGNAEGGSR